MRRPEGQFRKVVQKYGEANIKVQVRKMILVISRTEGKHFIPV
jgi:hypothetical protein